MRLCPPALAIPSVQRGHYELLSRKYLHILEMLFCSSQAVIERISEWYVCLCHVPQIHNWHWRVFFPATSPETAIKFRTPPLGPNMLMVDVFKLQNLFFLHHEGSHHHTGDFYPLNPTYSHKLVAATAAGVDVNIKFMTWTFCHLPLRHCVLCVSDER